MDELFPSMTVVIVPCTSGDVRVEHFDVSESDAESTLLRSRIKRDPDMYVPAGRYVRLFIGDTMMMSDTPMERRSNAVALRSVSLYRAETVLVGGLGIGMVTLGIASLPSVSRVTVIESNADVIRLVAPIVRSLSDKVEVVHADIFRWRPAKDVMFDYAYFDIWPYICSDNRKDFGRLRRIFGKYVRERRIDCWMENET